MTDPIDLVKLNFDERALNILNFVIAFIMYGIALEIKKEDFVSVLKYKKAFLVGMFCQFIFFPFFAYALTMIFPMAASIALGLILVTACPGGNLSNFLTSISKGNTALSISMSSVSTIVSIFMTPLNLSIWASLNPATANLMKTIKIDAVEVIYTVFVMLILPSILGVLTNIYLPKFSQKMQRPFKTLSIVFFILFLIASLVNNRDNFSAYVKQVFVVVALTNLAGLFFGYKLTTWFNLGKANARAVAFEVGIQNAGFGLVLVFNFFDGLGGMAIVCGWYGVWHLISGLTLASFWSKKNITETFKEVVS